MSPHLISPATTTYQDSIIKTDKVIFDDLILFRKYDENDQPTQLNSKQIALLGGVDNSFNINLCNLVNATERDRLAVQNIQVSIAATSDADVDSAKAASVALTAQARRWWQQSRMDAAQNNLYYSAGRDGDAFITAGYDSKLKRPVYSVNVAYDGMTGMYMQYRDGDPHNPQYAVKTWVETISDNAGNRISRRNIYTADAILKLQQTFVADAETATWVPFLDESTEDDVIEYDLFGQTVKAGVMWWTDTQTESGEPLGISVFHFAHNSNGLALGRSNLADIVPDLQNSVNLANASYIAAAQLDGFSVIWVTGIDEEDGKKVQRYPGSIMHGEAPEAKFGRLAGTNLEQLGAVVDRQIRYVSMITATPMVMLNTTSQIAAEGTLQQQEVPLIAKVENNQVAYGNAYEDMIRMSFRIDKVFGEGGGPDLAAIDELAIDTIWKSAATRDELNEINVIVQKVEKLGVPREQGWAELGYEPEDIAKWLNLAAENRTRVLGGLAEAILGGDESSTVTSAVTASANGGSTT